MHSWPPAGASPVQGGEGELLLTQVLVVVLGSVLVVISEFGLGQEGAKLHGLLWGTLEVTCQEGFSNVQEEDMPAKEGENDSGLLGITVSQPAFWAGVWLRARMLGFYTQCCGVRGHGGDSKLN